MAQAEAMVVMEAVERTSSRICQSTKMTVLSLWLNHMEDMTSSKSSRVRVVG